MSFPSISSAPSSCPQKRKEGTPHVASASQQGAVGKARLKDVQSQAPKVPNLPMHLQKKVQDPDYDPTADTSLTDKEIALLARYKNAMEYLSKLPPKRKKKKDPGIAEDLSKFYSPTIDEDGLEVDSVDSEDIVKSRLLYPKGKIPVGTINFLVAYSPAVLNGWVKQSSPACAAASAAGAWNAVLGFPRSSPNALSQDSVVRIMRSIVEDELSAKTVEVSKLFGEKDVNEFIGMFRASMIKDGLSPFIFDPKSQSEDITARIIRVIAETDEDQSNIRNIKKYAKGEEEKKRMWRAREKNSNDDKRTSVEGPELNHKEGKGKRGYDEELELESEGSGKYVPYAEIHTLIKYHSGLAKISAARPSTSFFGNDGVFKVFKRLAESYPNCDLFPRYLMGKSKRGEKEKYFKLNASDPPETIDRQWRGLRDSFMSFDTTIIFHQVNHYALIFAIREWVDLNGVRQRQVLTAKRGQRPTMWLHFTEIRRILLSWTGYKLIEIKRIGPQSFHNDIDCGVSVEVHRGQPRPPTPQDLDISWDL